MRTCPLLLIASLLAPLHAHAQTPKGKRKPKKTIYDFSDMTIEGELVAPSSSTLSFRVGGAQDLAFARAQIERGQVPRPEAITIEGLFAKHDLAPPPPSPCPRLLCAFGAAAPAALPHDPKSRYLAQISMSSSLNRATFQRAPLHLVIVIDSSGSMAGRPLSTAKAAARALLGQLQEKDQYSILSFSGQVRRLVQQQNGSRRGDGQRALSSLRARGSTAMSAGLRAAFKLAQQSVGRFDGTTRVVLLTDERPNVGRTDANSFMAIARDASQKGVGLTTLGVGRGFDPALAHKVSSVRGGNLFYLPSPERAQQTIEDRFASMVTELGYDLRIELSPAPGMRIQEVFGIPSERLERKGERVIVEVETLFLSKKKGALFVSLSGPPLMERALALQVNLQYLEQSGPRRSTQHDLYISPMTPTIERGVALIDQYTSMKRATRAYHQGDVNQAHRLLSSMMDRLLMHEDPSLRAEVRTVAQLEARMKPAIASRAPEATANTFEFSD